MRKLLFPLALAIPLTLTLTACGMSEEEQAQLEKQEKISKYSNPIYAENGKQACFDSLYEQMAKTKNLEDSIENEKSATFTMNTADGHESEGTMSWYATIETFAGIPWEHYVHCVADTSTDPATVTYLKATVPALDK